MIKLRIFLLLIMTVWITYTSAQTSGSKLQEKAKIDTRRGYDLRGFGFDSSLGFVARYCHQLPVIIAVGTKDEQFINEVKAIIRNMDQEGYEDLTLVLYDQKNSSMANGETHSILFFVKEDMKVTIKKINGKWGFVGISTGRNLSGIVLASGEQEYPLSVIQTQIRTMHKQAGSLNYVSQTKP